MIRSSVAFYPCRQMKETVEFYTGYIGLTVGQVVGDSILLDSGYGYIGFCEYRDHRAMALGVCICFNVETCEQVDEFYQKIHRLNPHAIVSSPKKHNRFPIYSFLIRDPNGYLVEIQKILS